MATSIDSFINILNMSIEDYSGLDSQQRERLYENLFKNKTDEEVSQLRDDVETELDAIYEEIYVQQRELEHIIDSKKSTDQEIAKAEMYLSEVEKMLSSLDSFSSDWGNAKSSLAKHKVDASDGQSYTFSAGAFVTEGEEFVINTRGSMAGEEGIFGPEDDDDESLEQDIFLQLNPTDKLEIAHFDPDSGKIRFAVTTENHVTYYVTLRGPANIRLSGSTGGLTPEILTSWPTTLIQRMYDSPGAKKSLFENLLENS